MSGMVSKFDEWEGLAIAWLDGEATEPPEPLSTADTLGLLQACKRVYAIERSVTQERQGHRDTYGQLNPIVSDIESRFSEQIQSLGNADAEYVAEELMDRLANWLGRIRENQRNGDKRQ